MADKPTIDPLGLMQALVSAWNQATPRPPAVETDTPSARMMAQALAAANMPSRAEVDEIAARLDRIEESLARIERRLAAAPRKSRKSAKPKV